MNELNEIIPKTIYKGFREAFSAQNQDAVKELTSFVQERIYQGIRNKDFTLFEKYIHFSSSIYRLYSNNNEFHFREHALIYLEHLNSSLSGEVQLEMNDELLFRFNKTYYRECYFLAISAFEKDDKESFDSAFSLFLNDSFVPILSLTDFFQKKEDSFNWGTETKKYNEKEKEIIYHISLFQYLTKIWIVSWVYYQLLLKRTNGDKVNKFLDGVIVPRIEPNNFFFLLDFCLSKLMFPSVYPHTDFLGMGDSESEYIIKSGLYVLSLKHSMGFQNFTLDNSFPIRTRLNYLFNFNTALYEDAISKNGNEWKNIIRINPPSNNIEDMLSEHRLTLNKLWKETDDSIWWNIQKSMLKINKIDIQEFKDKANKSFLNNNNLYSLFKENNYNEVQEKKDLQNIEVRNFELNLKSIYNKDYYSFSVMASRIGVQLLNEFHKNFIQEIFYQKNRAEIDMSKLVNNIKDRFLTNDGYVVILSPKTYYKFIDFFNKHIGKNRIINLGGKKTIWEYYFGLPTLFLPSLDEDILAICQWKYAFKLDIFRDARNDENQFLEIKIESPNSTEISELLENNNSKITHTPNGIELTPDEKEEYIKNGLFVQANLFCKFSVMDKNAIHLFQITS